MARQILIINGSPRKNGNTALLVSWFCEGARSKGATVKVIESASLKMRSAGCLSCRLCQRKKQYGCVIHDDVSPVLLRMLESDVIVMATPLYFFSASAQLKAIMDRMFSLYKWDNVAGTMETPLKGKTLAVLASAYEDVGLDVLEKPFRLTADYTGMRFASLLVAHAGVSGQIKQRAGVRKKALAFGAEAASGSLRLKKA